MVIDKAPDLEVQITENVRQGIALALEGLEQDELLLITGSLYLVGEARENWNPSREILEELETSN